MQAGSARAEQGRNRGQEASGPASARHKGKNLAQPEPSNSRGAHTRGPVPDRRDDHLNALKRLPPTSTMSLRVTAVLGGLRERLAGSTSTKPAKGGTKSLRVSPATKKATKSGKASDVKLAPAQRFNITLPGIQSKNAKGIPVEIGFTAANELFVGRMAMVGWALSLAGELLTGLGPLAQLGYETGVPIQDVEYGILALAGFNLLAALTPVSGRFVDEEALQRPAGPLQDNSISMVEPKKFFGVSGFGQFSKDNELFVGRVAQLGFAASLIGEAVTGKGALAQLNLETGIPLNEAEPLLLALIAFLFLASINEGRGKFIRDGN